MLRSSSVGPVRRVRTWAMRQRASHSDTPMFLFLGALVVAMTVTSMVWPDSIPYSALLLPMFLGSLWLTPRSVPWIIVGCLLAVVLMVLAQPIQPRGAVRITVTFVTALILLQTSVSTRRLGVTRTRSDSMFVDLRDRIVKQGRLPDLPDQWYAQSVIKAAGGTAFSGDFVVAGKDVPSRTVDIVLVDVSGKGVEAGTRSLLLSGAFGGLLSALTPKDFMVEANEYLLRQQWREGFATAIHLHLNVDTGEFELRKAGHPPAIWLKAGSGTWQVLDSDGPALGLLEDMEFEVVSGQLRSGDALLLYTDGLVETPGKDYTSGIDRLAGRAQRLFQTGFEEGAREVLDDLQNSADDCALVLLHRK